MMKREHMGRRGECALLALCIVGVLLLCLRMGDTAEAKSDSGQVSGLNVTREAKAGGVSATGLTIAEDGYYLIYTAQDLDKVREDFSANYRQMADIDMSSFGNWTPIGPVVDTASKTGGFTGIYDGNGHVIKNITVDVQGMAGLFGTITGGTIKNLGMVGGSIKGTARAAAFAAISYQAQDGTPSLVENCFNDGVSIYSSAGQTIGIASGYTPITTRYLTIRNCYNTGSITNDGWDCMGVGSWGAAIHNCYNTGIMSSINVNYYVGWGADFTDNASNNYYNKESAEQSTGHSGSGSYGTSKTTEEMKSPEFAALMGDAYYYYPGSYPKLKAFASAPLIGTNLSSTTVNIGEQVTFQADAGANPWNIKWQVKKAGSTSWSDIAGATSASYSFKSTYADNGNQYRYYVWNSLGTVTSAEATLTVIDNVAPTFDASAVPSDNYNYVAKLTVTDIEDVGSGVAEVFYSTGTAGETAVTGTAIPYDAQKKSAEIYLSGNAKETYYICVKDQVGNITRKPLVIDLANICGLKTDEDGNYLIYTADDLNAVRYNLKANYKQMADIDMGNSGNFIPIGKFHTSETTTLGYSGIYDGGGHVIKNLTIVSETYAGLFGTLSGGTIKNLGLEGGSMTGKSRIATFSPFSYKGENGSPSRIENCYNESCNLTCNAGQTIGIAGGQPSYTDCVIEIINCYNKATLINESWDCMGIASWGASMHNCYSAGTMKAQNAVYIIGFSCNFEGSWSNNYYDAKIIENGKGNATYATSSKTTEEMKKPEFAALMGDAYYYYPGSTPRLKAFVKEPIIQSSPVDTAVAEGSKAVFTVDAGGYPFQGQWQYRTGTNGTWTNLTGETALTYEVTATAAMNGRQYRYLINSGTETEVSSTVASLTVYHKPASPTLALEATLTADNWTKEAAFTLTGGTDPVGGQTLQYQLEKNTGTWTNYPGNKVSIATEGTHTVYGRAVNAKAEGLTAASTPVSVTVKIDKTAPAISGVAKDITTWTTGSVKITVTAADTGSGLAGAAYSFDGGTTWQSGNTKGYTGNTTLAANTIWVKDAVGNIAKYPTAVVIDNIDKTGPVISKVERVPDSWTSGDVTLKVTASDAGSGLHASETYSFDGGKAWQSSNQKVYTANEEIAADTICVKDVLGNVTKYAQVVQIDNIDKTEPTGQIKLLNAPSDITFDTLLNINEIVYELLFRQQKVVEISGTDVESGIGKLEYLTVNKGGEMTLEQLRSSTSWQEYDSNKKLNLAPKNTYVVYAKITNKANLSTYISSNGIIIDDAGPEFDAPVLTPTGDRTAELSVSNLTDSPSGVAEVFYSDSETAQSGTAMTLNADKTSASVTLKELAKGTYYVFAKDQAGNVSQPKSIAVDLENLCGLKTDEEGNYLLYTAQDVNAVRYNYAGSYKQMADIDLKAVYSNWTPICTEYNVRYGGFTGTYDGNGHRLLNMTIYDDRVLDKNGQYGSFFGKVSGAVIKNLGFENTNIQVTGRASLLATNAYPSLEGTPTMVDSCYGEQGSLVQIHPDDIQIKQQTVGIISGNTTTLSNAIVTNCYSCDYLEGYYWDVMGISAYGVQTKNCYYAGNAKAQNKVYAAVWGDMSEQSGNLYYDNEQVTQEIGDSATTIAKTTAELKDPSMIDTLGDAFYYYPGKYPRLKAFQSKPAIERDLTDITAENGVDVTLTADVGGYPLTIQWKYRENASAAWQDMAGENGRTCTIHATDAINGYQYCYTASNGTDTVTSRAATLTVVENLPAAFDDPVAEPSDDYSKVAKVTITNLTDNTGIKRAFITKDPKDETGTPMKISETTAVVYLDGNTKERYDVCVEDLAGNITRKSLEIDLANICGLEQDESGNYLIHNEKELNAVRYNLGASYKQTNDITLSGAAWIPIASYGEPVEEAENPMGPYDRPFTGSYDGRGFTITGLNNRLFYFVDGGTLQNIRLAKVNISLRQWEVAGLCARMGSGTVSNCGVVDGQISGTKDTAGLIALKKDGDAVIQNCFNQAEVLSDSGQAAMGGILGSGYGNLTMENCYNTGNVTGLLKERIGGILGGSENFSTGEPSQITLRNCYNVGEIHGKSGVGGIQGLLNAQTVRYQNCYNAGVVTAEGADRVGPILGGIFETEGTPLFENCYYDKEIDTDTVSGEGITGMTTAQMKAADMPDLLKDSTTGVTAYYYYPADHGYPRLKGFPEKPILSKEPSDQTVASGQEATFTVEAYGDSLSYSWQYLEKGGVNWTTISGAEQATYTFTAQNGDHDKAYRCVVSSLAGSTTTAGAHLTVYGKAAKPVIEAVASDGADYNGGDWASQVTFTLTLAEDLDLNGEIKLQYRLDMGDWQDYTAPVTLKTSGQYQLTARAVNHTAQAAGMEIITESDPMDVKVDCTAPDVKDFLLTTDEKTGEAIISFQARDLQPEGSKETDGSGITRVEYAPASSLSEAEGLADNAWTQITGVTPVQGAYTDYQFRLSPEQAGKHYYIRIADAVRDSAGKPVNVNIKWAYESRNLINVTGPVSMMYAVVPDSKEGFFAPEYTFTNNSGLNRLKIEFNSGISTKEEFTLLAEGNTTITNPNELRLYMTSTSGSDRFGEGTLKNLVINKETTDVSLGILGKAGISGSNDNQGRLTLRADIYAYGKSENLRLRNHLKANMKFTAIVKEEDAVASVATNK